MGRNSLKNRPTTRLSLKKVLIYTVVIGGSIAAIWMTIIFTTGTVVVSKTTKASTSFKQDLFSIGMNKSLSDHAPTGPGGVGTADGTSSLKIWYRTDKGMSVTAGKITGWVNSAGVSNHDLIQTGGNKPSVVAGAVNGYDEVSFTSNGHWLKTGQGTLDTSNFITDQASTFVVNRPDSVQQWSCLYNTEPLVGNSRFSNHIPWNGTVYCDIGKCCSGNARLQVGGVNGLYNYNLWSYDANPITGKQLYQNGVLLQSRPNTILYHSHNTQRFRIGKNYRGDVTEVIVFKNKINTAERMIVENYLSAKYNVGLSVGDLYIHDETINGDYDFDVAGIGKVDAQNAHDDSQGTGIVRFMNVQDLNDSEFLFWGHDNVPLSVNNSLDVPSGVDSRLERVWAVSELDINGNPVDVGAVDMVFDLTELGVVDASSLRLLIDTDSDGQFVDETPIAGAVLDSGNVFIFLGVTAIENGRYFTIATGPLSTLPIELINFGAEVIEEEYTLIQWTTVSEMNNDYFVLERSLDGVQFAEIETVTGAGNSTNEIKYEVEDYKEIQGEVYYRLTQTDFNGEFEVFPVIVVEWMKKANELEIISTAPNPFSTEFTVKFSVTQVSQVNMILISMNGNEILRKGLEATKGMNKYTFPYGDDLIPGTYILTIIDDQGAKVSNKVIKK